MSGRWPLTTSALPRASLDALAAEVERRAGSAPDAPPRPSAPEPEPEPEPEPKPPPLVQALLHALAEDADVARGFPPQSHRVLGRAVVAAKRGLRAALQPFFNEAFARQTAFNRRLLDTLSALDREQQRLQAEQRALAKRLARKEARAPKRR